MNTTEGLRARKKRLLRQQLSDTATRMFMERGFEAVRVVEVAEACGVSDKTVFNYFPAKEALVLDRLEGTIAALRAALATPGLAPLDAALRSSLDRPQEDYAQLQAQYYSRRHRTPRARSSRVASDIAAICGRR